MRRVLTLTLLALTAAVLLGLLWALQPSNVEVKHTEAVTKAPDQAYEMLYTRPRQDWESMTVTLSSGESFTVVSDLVFDAAGNLRGVTNTMGQPMLVQGQEDFALDSISFQMMLLAAQNIPITGKYDLDLTACGLSSPAARIEIFYRTGEMITLSIGHETASGYSCYVAMDGTDEVYLVPADFRRVMTRTLKEHHALPGALSADASAAVQIAVADPAAGQLIATHYASEETILDWRVESPLTHYGDAARIEAFVEGVCAIHAESYVGTVQTTAELESYGLHQPKRLIVALADGTIRDIHLGKDAGEGMVYARLDRTGDVYCIGRQQLAFAAYANLDGLLDRFVALLPLTEMASVTVHGPQSDRTLAFRWGEEKQPEVCLLDGKVISYEQATALYAHFIGLQFDKTAMNAVPAGEAETEIDFVLRDGTQASLTFYPYDDHYILVFTDGGGRFLIRREKVANLLDMTGG